MSSMENQILTALDGLAGGLTNLTISANSTSASISNLTAFDETITNSVSLATTVIGSTPVAVEQGVLVSTMDIPAEYNSCSP